MDFAMVLARDLSALGRRSSRRTKENISTMKPVTSTGHARMMAITIADAGRAGGAIGMAGGITFTTWGGETIFLTGGYTTLDGVLGAGSGVGDGVTAKVGEGTGVPYCGTRISLVVITHIPYRSQALTFTGYSPD